MNIFDTLKVEIVYCRHGSKDKLAKETCRKCVYTEQRKIEENQKNTRGLIGNILAR